MCPLELPGPSPYSSLPRTGTTHTRRRPDTLPLWSLFSPHKPEGSELLITDFYPSPDMYPLSAAPPWAWGECNLERSPPSERNSLCKGPRAEVPGESRAAEVGEVRDQGRTGCSLVSQHSGCELGEWGPTPTPLTRAGLPQDTGQPAVSHAAS